MANASFWDVIAKCLEAFRKNIFNFSRTNMQQNMIFKNKLAQAGKTSMELRFRTTDP